MGIVYPAKKQRGFNELSFLANYFDTVEINVSFYRPVSEKMAKTWLERVQQNSNFRFTAKLWRGFTVVNAVEISSILKGRATTNNSRPAIFRCRLISWLGQLISLSNNG